jgi:sphingomyelin phosphodiesterase acid-like 3
MRTHRAPSIHLLFLVLSALSLLTTGPLAAQSPAAPATVAALFLSDIHLNPFQDPALIAKLDGQPTPDTKAALNAEPPATSSPLEVAQQACRRLPDTSDELFRSSVAAMQPHAASVNFVTVSGDLIAHQFIRCFTAFVLKQQPQQSESAQYIALNAEQKQRYRNFVQNTIQYVTDQLHQTFLNTPIYYALGNNDSDCGDYNLDAHGKFLSNMADIVVKSLPANLSQSERDTVQADFSSGGYYSAPLAAAPNTRVLVLDDVFMSVGYATCAGKADPAPAAAQLAWLRAQFETLSPNENVWIMGHIPPGLDPFSTLKNRKTVMFLEHDFSDLLTSQNNVIRLALFAHTHIDCFSPLLFCDTVHPVTLKLVQSISPDHGNPPTFTLARIDPKTGALTEYTLIKATKSSANGSAAEYVWPDAGTPLPPPTWSSTTPSPR